MGNKEILTAIQLILNTKTEYGLSIDYDTNGNPIIKVAPVVKVEAGKQHCRKDKNTLPVRIFGPHFSLNISL